MLVGFWILSLGEMYVRLRWRNSQFKANSIFFADGKDRFRDFTNFDPITERFIAYRYEGGARIEVGYPTIGYPAPMMCGYLLFTRVFPVPLYAYLAFIVISVTLGATRLALALSASSTIRFPLLSVLAVSVILSYPLMCLLERANMEGFIWAVLALGFTAFVARHHLTAGLLFALAASHRICTGDLLDLCDGLLQSLAGEMGTPPSECPDTKPGPEGPRVFRRHRQKIFWHTVRAWP
jgi:hypothetical protein